MRPSRGARRAAGGVPIPRVAPEPQSRLPTKAPPPRGGSAKPRGSHRESAGLQGWDGGDGPETSQEARTCHGGSLPCRARGTGRAGPGSERRDAQAGVRARGGATATCSCSRSAGWRPRRVQARLSGAPRRAPGASSAGRHPGGVPGAASSGFACRARWRAARPRSARTGRRPCAPRRARGGRGRPRPDAPARSSSVSEGLGNFGVGSWPGACWRPYADDSPFNQRLPRRPRLDPRSDAIVRRVTGWGEPAELRAGVAGTTERLAAPDLLPGRATTRSSRSTAPRAGAPARSRACACASPTPPRPAAGSDGHLTVVDQDSRLGVRLLAGAAQAARRRPPRDLLGRAHPHRRGRPRAPTRTPPTTARSRESSAPRRCAAAASTTRSSCSSAATPAARSTRLAGWGCACDSSAGAPSQGTRFQLDLSPAEIDALRVPDWKKTILRAMAEYGLYVGDTTGGTPWNIWFESGATYTSFGRRDPMVALRARRRDPRARPTARATSTGRAGSTGAATCGWWTPAWPSGAASLACSRRRSRACAGGARAR